MSLYTLALWGLTDQAPPSLQKLGCSTVRLLDPAPEPDLPNTFSSPLEQTSGSHGDGSSFQSLQINEMNNITNAIPVVFLFIINNNIRIIILSI